MLGGNQAKNAAWMIIHHKRWNPMGLVRNTAMGSFEKKVLGIQTLIEYRCTC